MTRHNSFDTIVIGAGSAGLTTAIGLSKVGQKVLLIEREHMGGECTNTGCIPSKALLHHARTYHQSQKIAGQTPASEEYRQQAFNYVRHIIDEVVATETPAHFIDQGILVVLGEAVFTSPNSLTVANETYTFTKAVIATGSAPRLLDIPDLDPDSLLTNQNLFQLETIPARTLVIGAGPIGLEMGQALALLGSQVTIATIDDTFAHLEDPAIRPILKQRFADLGINLELQAHIQSAANQTAIFERRVDGVATNTFSVPFDKLLLAIGRVPNLPTGLTAANIAFDRAGITTNTQFRTTNPRVYAIGDVTAKLKFTHTADDAARRLIPHLVSRGLLRVRTQGAVPKVTYTDPEMAQVGVSWEEAAHIHGADRLHRLVIPLETNDRAITDHETDGTMVVIGTRLSGKILGVHYIGPRAGEIITTFTVAIDNQLTLWKLRRTIYAYPTYSLLIKKLTDLYLATQIKTLRTDLIHLATAHSLKVAAAILWATGLYVLYTYVQSTEKTTLELALLLFTFMTGTIWGPLLYILAYAVRPLTFLPGSLLTILSGVFFGLWGGIIYTIIGANLSATLAYAIGRFFSQTHPREIGAVATLRKFLHGSPFMSILITRLTFMPYDVINFGAGLLKIPFIPYLTATIIGTILGIATFVSIGASVQVEELLTDGLSFKVIDGTFILLSIGIFVISLVLSHVYKTQTKVKS